MNEKYDIFISYSRKDKHKVIPFVNQLENAIGNRCWIDKDGIESGSKFEDEIINAIDKCKILIFMHSENSLVSEWTKREVLYAEGEGKIIIPVLVDGNSLKGWYKFHFGNVDFVILSNSDHIYKLIKTVSGHLNITPAISYNNEALNYLYPYIDHNKVGLKSTLDNRVYIEPKYDIICRFHEGKALVKFEGKYGYIDKTGKEIVPCLYSRGQRFQDNLAWVGKFVGDSEYYAAIDETGNIIIPFKEYRWSPNPFSEGMAAFYDNGYSHVGFVDKWGQIIIPCIYKVASSENSSFSYGHVLLKDEKLNRYVIISKENKRVVSIDYSCMAHGTFGEGMIGFKRNSKYGFIDIIKRKITIAPHYPYFNSPFSEGLHPAPIKLNEREGYIDKEDNMVIEPIYEFAGKFCGGIASVQKNGLYGAIDKKNNIIIPFKYDFVYSNHGGVSMVEIKDGKIRKFGLLNSKGETILPCIYDSIIWKTDNVIWAEKNGQLGAIDNNNNIIIPFYNNRLNYFDGPALYDIDMMHLVDNDHKQFFMDIWGNTMVYNNILYGNE